MIRFTPLRDLGAPARDYPNRFQAGLVLHGHFRHVTYESWLSRDPVVRLQRFALNYGMSQQRLNQLFQPGASISVLMDLAELESRVTFWERTGHGVPVPLNFLAEGRPAQR